MPSTPVSSASKKQRPRKQARLKKRKLAGAEAGVVESEDEDAKAARVHNQQQKPAEKPEEQEKPTKKRKAGDANPKSASGEKKPRLSKNKRVKAKAQEEHAEEAEGAEEAGDEGMEASEKKEARFIVFIGNLPFTATKAALEKHFAPVQPTSVRLITHKDDPKKCKGFAFLEFEGYDRMQSCLLKFHHTMFNDGTGERKINVELTAGGGGGKSQARKTKLETKNQKLDEQRKRKIEEEEKLKREKKAQQLQTSQSGMESGIHPSRRRQVR